MIKTQFFTHVDSPHIFPFFQTDPTKVQQLDMQGLYDEDTAEETKQGLMEEDGAESTTSEDRDIKSDFFTSAHLVELPLANVQVNCVDVLKALITPAKI